MSRKRVLAAARRLALTMALPIWLLGVLAAPQAAQAASNTATATGIALATIIQPITVQMRANLDFGMVASAVSGSGTVIISPATGSASYAGSAAPACAAAPCPKPHPAQFAVRGEAGRAYTIALPASVTLTNSPQSGDSTALTVNMLTVRTHSRPAAGNAGLLDAAGADSFELGGTLILTPGLPSARYQVSVPVMVTYS